MLQDAGFDFNQTIKLATYNSDRDTTDMMDAVVGYLNDIGVKAEWKLLTGDLGVAIYTTRDYHLIYAGLSALAFEEAFDPYGSTSRGGFATLYPAEVTVLDSLLNQLHTTADATKRKQIQMEIQKVDSEQMMWCLPLFTLKNIQVFNTARVKLPSDLVLANEWQQYERHFDKWTLTPAAQ
jgi:ABC-type transport system substrate-binding protein